MHACERKRVRRGVKTANKKKEEGEEINEKRRRKKEREKEKQYVQYVRGIVLLPWRGS